MLNAIAASLHCKLNKELGLDIDNPNADDPIERLLRDLEPAIAPLEEWVERERRRRRREAVRNRPARCRCLPHLTTEWMHLAGA